MHHDFARSNLSDFVHCIRSVLLPQLGINQWRSSALAICWLQRRRVELDLAGEKPARQKYNLDLYHTHFVIVNGSTAKTITTFRTDLEKELQKFSSCRKNFGNGVAENSSDDEDAHSVIPSRPPTAESTTARMGVPLVALMIQGGPNEIQQIWQYLKNRTPVVVVKGSGLVADLFAYVYEEVSFRYEQANLVVSPSLIRFPYLFLKRAR